ncbi:MAG: hypothetical protein K6G65_02370 [Lachnospiraceae bacterium]|nr:hypothetical protein [Lachnospiraceae bacterium]
MIDFEKELEQFEPSLEIDQVNDAIYKNDITDMTDILKEALNHKQED